MYVPRFAAVADDELRAMVATVGAADLVTSGADGFPVSTLMPVLWLGSGQGSRLVAHMARTNSHWRQISAGMPALAIVSGAQAYVSPSWYAAKAEHGRVVPTWNYDAVHLTGRATVHDDPDWVRDAVTQLTATHEAGRRQPWSVTDAPEAYVAQQLRAIVGVELVVERVEGKAKLSQNRSAADRAGVVDGLLEAGTRRDLAVAERMAGLES